MNVFLNSDTTYVSAIKPAYHLASVINAKGHSSSLQMNITEVLSCVFASLCTLLV